MIRGAIQVGKQALSFGPTLIGTSTEWAFDEARAAELRSVSKASGGRELLDLHQAWRSPRIVRFTDMNGYLLVAALLLMLLEAFVTRSGWKMPEWAFAGWRAKPVVRRPDAKSAAHLKRLEPKPAASQPVAALEAAPEAPKMPEVSAEERQRRFDRAKRRGGG